MKPIEYLQQARALIEKGWIQGAYYINLDGTYASLQDEAAGYCMMGAMQRVGYKEKPNEAYWKGDFLVAICALQEVIGPGDGTRGGMIMWNDIATRTKEEVLAAFDAAIKKVSV